MKNISEWQITSQLNRFRKIKRGTLSVKSRNNWREIKPSSLIITSNTPSTSNSDFLSRLSQKHSTSGIPLKPSTNTSTVIYVTPSKIDTQDSISYKSHRPAWGESWRSDCLVHLGWTQLELCWLSRKLIDIVCEYISWIYKYWLVWSLVLSKSSSFPRQSSTSDLSAILSQK